MHFKITANKYSYKDIIGSILVLLTAVFFSCNENKEARNTEPAFYYWKSVFKLSDFEKQRLDSLHVKTIYIKFFDVDWDDVSKAPLPVAKLQTISNKQQEGMQLIPTVFITNECIQKIDSLQIQALAGNIHTLVNDIIKANNFTNIPEIQIDCDWTAVTRAKYFALLSAIKKQSGIVLLSATIRLHQVKFFYKTGVPPVDKGLLMCYNMGNLKNPATKNSILETEELKKYIGNLSTYPLPLDVALPLFEWKVLFHNNMYTGLIENLPDTIFTNDFVIKKENRLELLKDTLLQGYDLRKGDILRNEQSNYSEILSAAAAINTRLKNTHPRVSLYHLDSVILSKYSLHELETIYNSLR
ncbi:hypothetical protein [Ferruginibacter sp. SUN106]|uniref:hypothetical protein n=1 Tax=Ferruginibacter sp. SUN106 TaxID=2978348 RepID=UPI003D364831